MKVRDIITAVKTNMDEIGENDAEFMSGQDNKEMETIIESKIMEAYLFVLRNAREDLIGNDLKSILRKSNVALTVPAEGEYVDLPLDEVPYLRIILVRLQGWVKAVRWEDFIEEGTDDEARVMDEVSGASWERPAVILMQSFRGLRLVGAQPKLAENGGMSKLDYNMMYIPEPLVKTDGTVGDDTEINLGDKLNMALINYITGLVWVTYNDNARAENMFELAMTEMGVENKQE